VTGTALLSTDALFEYLRIRKNYNTAIEVKENSRRNLKSIKAHYQLSYEKIGKYLIKSITKNNPNLKDYGNGNWKAFQRYYTNENGNDIKNILQKDSHENDFLKRAILYSHYLSSEKNIKRFKKVIIDANTRSDIVKNLILKEKDYKSLLIFKENPDILYSSLEVTPGDRSSTLLKEKYYEKANQTLRNLSDNENSYRLVWEKICNIELPSITNINSAKFAFELLSFVIFSLGLIFQNSEDACEVKDDDKVRTLLFWGSVLGATGITFSAITRVLDKIIEDRNNDIDNVIKYDAILPPPLFLR